MKLEDRERVDGTQVTIGRRVYYRGGTRKIGRRYAAEYRDGQGRQRCRNLGTTSRPQARRLAVEIQQEIERGVTPATDTPAPLDELADRYQATVEARGAALKTQGNRI